MNIHFITLGCPKNIVDSEVILGKLKGESVTIVDEPQLADAIVINTCGFINDAKKESIDAILSAVQRKKLGECRYVFVTGCLSQRYMSELRKELPEIDGFWGARNIENIPFEMTHKMGLQNRRNGKTHRFLTTEPGHAYLKIAEGCDHLCSFCSIPFIRGSYHSRTDQDIVEEAEWLAEQGIKEIILVSQDTTAYGTDLKSGQSLPSLLRKLENIPGIQWIRLLYTYPDRISDELIDVIADSDKICHYLDIPIQHISDDILRRMKRSSRRKKIEKIIQKIRSRIPDVFLRTTLMVGFPGETEAEFQELYDFVEETRFQRAGVFQFSPEDGTEAAQYPHQVPNEAKEERYCALMELQQDILFDINQEWIGKKMELLVDRTDGNGGVVGRSRWDAPDIDPIVRVNAEIPPGNIFWATIQHTTEYELYGDVC